MSEWCEHIVKSDSCGYILARKCKGHTHIIDDWGSCPICKAPRPQVKETEENEVCKGCKDNLPILDCDTVIGFKHHYDGLHLTEHTTSKEDTVSEYHELTMELTKQLYGSYMGSPAGFSKKADKAIVSWLEEKAHNLYDATGYGDGVEGLRKILDLTPKPTQVSELAQRFKKMFPTETISDHACNELAEEAIKFIKEDK